MLPREGGAPCQALQSRSLESVLGYGFIIESSQQQYEPRAIHVLFPPSPGCHSCAASSPVLAQFFAGAMLCSWFVPTARKEFSAQLHSAASQKVVLVELSQQWIGKRGKKLGYKCPILLLT